MRISVSIGDVFVEVDDETGKPTLDAIESVLKRTVEAAVEAYSLTGEVDEDFEFEDEDEEEDTTVAED
jgi:methyl coenzyme M reductase subunit D